jgi:hypothetical protein
MMARHAAAFFCFFYTKLAAGTDAQLEFFPFPLPPHSEPLSIGTVEGFVSDSPDVEACGAAAVGDLSDLREAMHDFEHGVATRNLTEIVDALREVRVAMNASKAVKVTCKEVAADVDAIIARLKQIHGPMDLLKHMVQNLVQDREKIFSELEAADRAYKAGSDYKGAGRELGMALRHMLVGELNGDDAATLPPHAWRILAMGLAEGFIADGPDALECVAGIEGEASDWKQAIHHLKEGLMHMNKTDVLEAIQEIQAAVREIKPAKEECKAMLADMHNIREALKSLHGPKDILRHLVEDRRKISVELESAHQDEKNGNYSDAGKQLGMAVRRILVGELNSTRTTTAVVVV